jgi:hypothetical protein
MMARNLKLIFLSFLALFGHFLPHVLGWDCSTFASCITCTSNSPCGWCTLEKSCVRMSNGTNVTCPLGESAVASCECSAAKDCSTCVYLDNSCSWCPSLSKCVNTFVSNDQCPGDRTVFCPNSVTVMWTVVVILVGAIALCMCFIVCIVCFCLKSRHRHIAYIHDHSNEGVVSRHYIYSAPVMTVATAPPLVATQVVTTTTTAYHPTVTYQSHF